MALRTLLSMQRALSTLRSPSSSFRSIATAILVRSPSPSSSSGLSRGIPRGFSSEAEGGWTPPLGGRVDSQKLDAEMLLPGCDFKHWLVFVDTPPEGTSRDDIIDGYVKMLAKAIGSEEEARMKIYSVSTRYYYAFGAIIPREACDTLKQMPGVQWVLPDSYLDPKTKDYGGEPFINGKAVPYDPKYHKVWLQNRQNQEQQGRRKFDRPRGNWQRPRPQYPNQIRDFQKPRDPSMPNQNRDLQNPRGPSIPGQNHDSQNSSGPSMPPN